MQVNFESLLKALQHHPFCPLCQSSLTPDCRSFSPAHLTINIGYTDAPLRINLETQDIDWEDPLETYVGAYLNFLTLDCRNCLKFGYVLLLTFDLNIPTLTSIRLDSESILWGDAHNTLHEVKSRYPSETSQYSVFPDFKDITVFNLNYHKEDSITLPFIPINFSQPEETIQRAQTMAVFS